MPNTLVPLPTPPPAGRAPEVCLVAGDAAAAVKLAPLASAMRARKQVRPVLLACGDDARAATEVLSGFGLATDVLVELVRDGQGTPQVAAQLLTGLDHAFADRPPAAVVVQGDSATAFSAAMAAFWRRVPVVHLDAGVRSFDLTAPFPQEGHRRLIAQVSSLHLTATPDAAANLAQECHGGPKVVTVGSTAVDAGFDALDRYVRHQDARVQAVENAVVAGEVRLGLVVLDAARWPDETAASVLHGIADLVLACPDLEVVLPIARGHLRHLAYDMLGRLVRVTITDPLPQPELVCLLSVAAAVVTDTSTPAEQAPSFGVPALLLGGEPGTWTEPQAVGHPWTAGGDRAVIARITEKLVLTHVERLTASPTDNPFGDGFAAIRCEQAVQWLLGLRDRPTEFTPR
ncbi:UDP-N-acetylglucosamine 2-epimerase [Actinokineospora globicatena]|uniref:UDP-N-acetylglucosamine 2-epimerase (non-hydrolyzing) n=1 Tax=Actinokineospora globicatena TaxID=103729 RepID=A0A9W6VCL2_9PSEU|nr:UDP-N-acetylglucosamine 2-epimerase [Actinokineospora globicatena]MCP2304879.1 UDP-N-acetylglucosamine 2-epimerase (non-hydrolyzing) [Actinokineospora globicatena]GLW77740.1 UDP-N-acetyl glucosamine 2-epimerase [Actinokineospora globicatena]GLW85591.1 UDP-N-acetyl glucosamine 2-epimerase [Actinokineospora globicatena]GLW94341.1 UDP-N-acetyl glucosamine 2-epimerase [Actinokineospora globicatena]